MLIKVILVPSPFLKWGKGYCRCLVFNLTDININFESYSQKIISQELMSRIRNE